MDKEKKLTKDEFLARCSTAYDIGLVTTESLKLLELWVDNMMRLEHSFLGSGQTQMSTVLSFFEDEKRRLQQTPNSVHVSTLAADSGGYTLIKLTALLGHHCQICAVDPGAWHTRSGFCPHRNQPV